MMSDQLSGIRDVTIRLDYRTLKAIENEGREVIALSLLDALLGDPLGLPIMRRADAPFQVISVCDRTA
jgi:hypothetical protein